ncbi:MAG TPA: hypothetical protein VFV39_07680, partial [Limnobacter sp.]|nr:hypothetical protein [Limnobacter sp.]
VHALLQRTPADRQQTMDWLIKNRDLIGEHLAANLRSKKFETLISKQDAAGQWFLNQLTERAILGAPVHLPTKIRRNSLREAADKLTVLTESKSAPKEGADEHSTN